MVHRTGGRDVESTVNVRVAEIIQESGWCTAEAEQTRTVLDKNGLRPDIIVRPQGTGSANRAVIIELETNNKNLEREVSGRVTIMLKHNVTPSAVIGVLFPQDLAHAGSMAAFRDALESAELEYFVRDQAGRFPPGGYLKGSISDVVTATRLSMIPKRVVDDYTRTIQDKIQKISAVLAGTDDGVKTNIINILGYNRNPNLPYGMSDEQAGHMAALMILNASIFYEVLASHVDYVDPLSSLGGALGAPTKHQVMTGMRRILKINYAPVFKAAIRLLNAIPDGFAAEIIDTTLSAVSAVMRLGMQNSGDVYGALYQNDLIERKKSASFYTRPEAAALLAALALPPPGDDVWSDISQIKKFRIGDFACGTGMLLTAAYQHVINCHGNDSATAGTHPETMRDMLWGFDIMPTATHLTVSNLASIYPGETFPKSRIYQMPIGIQMPTKKKKPVYALGSLDLIRNADAEMAKRSMALEVGILDDGSSRSGKRHGGRDDDSLSSIRLKTRSFDFVMMNPPFVRATNHGAGRADPVPPFAVFGTGPEVQTRMSETDAQLYSKACSSGNAGLASYFIAIAHQKLKSNGVMGFILPATITSGASWANARGLLNRSYRDIVLVRLRRSAGTGESTFSSNTGMEEVLLVARKRNAERSEGEYPRIRFVLLDRLPASRLEGREVAKIIQNTTPNRLEHGMGGTSLSLGDTHIGDMLDCPVEGGRWMLARTSNIHLLQFAYSLVTGRRGVEMTWLNKMSDVGKLGRDIADAKDDKSPRAPFKKVAYDPQNVYHGLWNNNSATQRSMLVPPDCTLEKKSGATPRHARDVWNTRTHLHINLQVRYTSQRLVAAYTKEPTMGGTAWPNVILNEPKYGKAFTAWFNSVFGILTYWFAAGSQQIGRGRMSLTSCKEVPVPNFDRMDGSVIERLDAAFDDLCAAEMKPINMLDADGVRQELDRRVMNILGLEVDSLGQIYDWLVHEKQMGRRDLAG